MIYVLIGVVFEVYWAWGLKHLMENLWGILSIFIALSISFSCLIQACKTLEVSVAYTVFTGLGASGLVVIDMLSLGFNLSKFLLICLLLLGVVGIKMTNTQEAKHEEIK